jgi:ERCC4-type nuclease
MSSFIFKLSEGIEVTKRDKDGQADFETYHEIEFKAPYYACFSIAGKLEQVMTRALLESANKIKEINEQEQEKESERRSSMSEDDKMEEKITGVKLALLASSEDFEKIMNYFIKLLPFVSKLDEGLPLQKKNLKYISYNDLKDMIFEYIANFLMPSL